MDILSVVISAGTLVMAVADGVPTLRVEPSCRAAAATQMALSQSYDACVKDEMSARASLVQNWETFTAADRVRCSSEATLDGVDSYVDLLVCLQMTKDVQGEKTTLKGARRK